MPTNLAEGNLLRNMLRFSLPFLLSYFLQTLYGLVDLFVAGQFYGADVITAVSVGSQVMHMLTVMIVGLSTGSVVMIGRYVGSRETEKMEKSIGNTISLFLLVAVILTIPMLFLVRPVISVMSVPRESVSSAAQYLSVCFAGLPCIIAYNVLSAIFRGMGDSKTPMVFVAIACVLNIFLDILFMGPLGLGARGAAWATVIGQGLSVVLAFISIVRKGLFRVRRDDFRLERKTAGNILAIGVPLALQEGFIQISFLVITVIANRRGVSIAAAVGIVEKTISFLFLVPSSAMSTISSVSTQCIGAGAWDKARKCLFWGMGISALIGVIWAFLFQFHSLSSAFFTLFTRDAVVVEYATQYMRTYSLDCVLASVHFAFSGFFGAVGVSYLSFLHNVISVLAVRIPLADWASVRFPETLYAMGAAAPAGSFLSILLCICFYRMLRKKGKVL